jgi:microcystin-dependent protein
MSTPFIGELKLVSFNFPPKGWSACNGQLLAINQNQALFSLLGTYYGGNGIQTFALPNMQGRTPISMGNGFTIGQVAGEESHTLLAAETPAHSHTVNANSGTATTNAPGGNYLAATTAGFYAAAAQASGTLNSQSVTTSGGSQPHENRQPYLVMNWVIALAGIFPSRN